MLKSLDSVIIIFSLIAIGYLLAKKGILSDVSNGIFSKLVVTITLPATLITGLTSRFTREDLRSSLIWLLLGMAGILLTSIPARIMGKVFKEKTSGIFLPVIIFSNTIFIGLPVNITLFGESAVPYAFIYYLANTLLFWSYGVSMLNDSEKFNVKGFFKKLFNPSIIAFIVGVILILLDLKIPSAPKSVLKYLSNLTTPLSLLFIGTTLGVTDTSKFKFTKNIGVVFLGKFILLPLMMVLLFIVVEKVFHLNPPLLLKKVFIMTSTMPSMTNVAIVAKYYGKNYEGASVVVGLGTLFTIITIPLYSFLISSM